MEHEARDLREAPVTWRQYLAYAGQSADLFKWVWSVIPAESKKRIKWLFVTVIPQILVSLSTPWFIGVLVDGATRRASDVILFGLSGAFISMAIARVLDFIFAVNREWVLGLNWGAVDQFITEQFFAKSVGQHIQESSRLSVANIDKGRWRLFDLQALMFFEGIKAIGSLVFAYAFLGALWAPAGIIMTVGIGAYLLWTLFLNQKVMMICTPVDAQYRKLNRHRVETWEKVERVKTSTRSSEELHHMGEWFNRLIVPDIQFWVWFIRNDFGRGGIIAVCLIVAMGYACIRVLDGVISAPLLLPLFSWSSQIVENIWRIGHIEHQLNWNAPSVRSMIEAVSLEPDVKSGSYIIDRTQPIEIVFDKVYHRFPSSEWLGDGTVGTPVLENISFKINPGEKVALLGESGAGKTTVMRLLLRCMDPTSGVITVQGRDLREIDLDSWWGAVGYIPQKDQVVDGTIRTNLLYAVPPEIRAMMTDDELWNLARMLKIDFGARLTKGLETLVGKNGLQLSGGQAQRLMIGAAVIKKPAFMVIDEATSSLDSTTEKLVQKGLKEVLTSNVGALIVAHRLSTVQDICTKFVVIRTPDPAFTEETQVEAVAGSFEELFEISPTFRRLAIDQKLSISSKDESPLMHIPAS